MTCERRVQSSRLRGPLKLRLHNLCADCHLAVQTLHKAVLITLRSLKTGMSPEHIKEVPTISNHITEATIR